MQTTHGTATDPASHHNVTIEDVQREAGQRWDVAAVPQGYRAIPPTPPGATRILLYGRTPAELAESIHMAQVPS